MSPFSNALCFSLLPDCPLTFVLRFLNPTGMFTGAAVVVAVFLGAVWAGDNKAIIRNFKKDNPTLFVFLVMFASYLVMSLFGGVMVLLIGIKLPLICESHLFMSCERCVKMKAQNVARSNEVQCCPFAFQWSSLMLRCVCATWRTSWRIRWRVPDWKSHPWAFFSKHSANRKRI